MPSQSKTQTAGWKDQDVPSATSAPKQEPDAARCAGDNVDTGIPLPTLQTSNFAHQQVGTIILPVSEVPSGDYDVPAVSTDSDTCLFQSLRASSQSTMKDQRLHQEPESNMNVRVRRKCVYQWSNERTKRMQPVRGNIPKFATGNRADVFVSHLCPRRRGFSCWRASTRRRFGAGLLCLFFDCLFTLLLLLFFLFFIPFLFAHRR